MIKEGGGGNKKKRKLTASPTTPKPKIATVEPECTLAVFQAPPTPTHLI